MKENYFKELQNVLVFYFHMEPHLKWNKNVLAWLTNGGGSGTNVFKNNFILTWNHGLTDRLRYSVFNNKLHLRSTAMRPKIDINGKQ